MLTEWMATVTAAAMKTRQKLVYRVLSLGQHQVRRPKRHTTSKIQQHCVVAL